MKKLFLVSLVCVLSSCCTTQTPTCPEQFPPASKETELEKQKAEEQAAWAYAENEELVSAFEQSNLQKWVVGVSKNVVLAEIHEIEFNMTRYFGKVYFRVSIFSNGTLFLDGEKKEVGMEHTTRLISLFKKIIEVKGK